jgi:signal peptidase I
MGKRAANAVLIGFGVLAVLGAICLVLRLFVFDITTIHSDDMSPTLGPGSLVVVNRLATPKKGDLVMLKTEKGTWEVRRVIAVGGDRVGMSGSEPVVNGVTATVTEVRATKDATGEDFRVLRESSGGHEYLVLDRVRRTMHDMPEQKVGEGFYVLSDNRESDAAADSRRYGAVPKSRIRGVVSWIVKRGKVP